MNASLCKAQSSQLLVVDVQTRLLAAMEESRQARLVKAVSVLLTAAGSLSIPVWVTEQYPKGLGPTVPELAAALPESAARLEKTRFSACGTPDFLPRLGRAQRRQIILVGMETHVCVLQTAFELLGAGFQVFVVSEGVCSRSEAHQANALERMSRAGAEVSNLESVLFEWLDDAAHPHFKALSALIR